MSRKCFCDRHGAVNHLFVNGCDVAGDVVKDVKFQVAITKDDKVTTKIVGDMPDGLDNDYFIEEAVKYALDEGQLVCPRGCGGCWIGTQDDWDNS
jgi:hypothetical protein